MIFEFALAVGRGEVIRSHSQFMVKRLVFSLAVRRPAPATPCATKSGVFINHYKTYRKSMFLNVVAAFVCVRAIGCCWLLAAGCWLLFAAACCGLVLATGCCWLLVAAGCCCWLLLLLLLLLAAAAQVSTGEGQQAAATSASQSKPKQDSAKFSNAKQGKSKPKQNKITCGMLISALQGDSVHINVITRASCTPPFGVLPYLTSDKLSKTRSNQYKTNAKSTCCSEVASRK